MIGENWCEFFRVQIKTIQAACIKFSVMKKKALNHYQYIFLYMGPQ